MIEPFNGGPADQPYNMHNADNAAIVHYEHRANRFERLDRYATPEEKNAIRLLRQAQAAEVIDPTPWLEHFTPIDRFGLWGERDID